MPYITIFIFLFFSLSCIGQTTAPYSCGDDQLRNLLRQVDTAYDQMQYRSNVQLKSYIDKVQRGRSKPILQRPLPGDSGFVIPVVVHIIYPSGTPYGSGTNISYAQVRSQVEALNAAFNKSYPTYNGQAHPAYAANANIRFCLATSTQDTSQWATGPGGTEYGVIRYADRSGAYDHTITADGASRLLKITHPSNNFSFEKYLNIWLVSSIDGGNNIMGYAPRPLMPGYLLDGVVMRADIFGDNTAGGNYQLNFGLKQGKILAHEVGHYLNLYHIFQGGCAGMNAAGAATDPCDLNGDLICDIEPSTTQNTFCTGASPNTCIANYPTGTVTDDMINDYMSYADDDCMTTFTQNQVQRMWATLQLQRTNLWKPENLAVTGVIGSLGCVPSYLNAGISTDNAVFCAGTAINFYNSTAGNTATEYEWEFPGGNPATSTAGNVTVTFNQPGNYKAILKVSDGTNTRTDSLLFAVQECKLDSSLLSMSHWYFGNFGSLDFTAGTPVQTKVALEKRTIQGEYSYPAQLLPFLGSTISISDSLGNLLFYSNAVSVWNKDHQKITTSPMFGASDINASSGFCYVPFPGNKRKYFAVGVYPNFDESPSGIRFVTVDLDSNTVTAYKEFNNPALPNRFSQFLTVVPHCNGTDYWIITKGFGLANTRFYSLLVTESGIDETQEPVISEIFRHPGFGGSGNQLKCNRQGNKLLLCSPHGYENIEVGALYDFDSRTGMVTNEKKIPNISAYSPIQGGGAFSPNGEYFYMARSTNFATNGPPYWLFQYRVSDLAYNVFEAPGFYFASSYQLGPDNKIYITTQQNKVAQIAAPDEWGHPAFNGEFIDMMAMDNEIRPNVSIPSFIDAKFKEPTHPDFSVFAVNCNTFRFSSFCFDKYTASWNFGDGSALQTGNTVEHLFNPGEYTVTLSLSAGTIVYGSVAKKVNVLPIAAGITGPATVCTNGDYATQFFTIVSPGVKYKWTITKGGSLSGPDNLPFANIIWAPNASEGIIRLEVVRDNCVLNDTKTVSLSHGPSITWALPDSICFYDSSLVLTADPAGGSFSGTGVINNIFYPATAGEGYHTLTYTYFNESTCLGQAERTIKVPRCKIPTDQNTDCDEILNGIYIAPNPVNNMLQLKSPYVLKYVQVYNSVGQKVTSGTLSNNSIQLLALAAGVYSVLVYCEKNNSFKAFRFFKL